MPPLTLNGTNGVSAVQAGAVESGDLPAGSVIQVVRETSGTDQTTTSTAYVDANLSVTIAPKKNNSLILLIYSGFVAVGGSSTRTEVQITDAFNNTVSGAERGQITLSSNAATLTVIGYSAPSTTNAVTYKVRFKTQADSATLINSLNLGQLYAIEVAA